MPYFYGPYLARKLTAFVLALATLVMCFVQVYRNIPMTGVFASLAFWTLCCFGSLVIVVYVHILNYAGDAYPFNHPVGRISIYLSWLSSLLCATCTGYTFAGLTGTVVGSVVIAIIAYYNYRTHLWSRLPI